MTAPIVERVVKPARTGGLVCTHLLPDGGYCHASAPWQILIVNEGVWLGHAACEAHVPRWPLTVSTDGGA